MKSHQKYQIFFSSINNLIHFADYNIKFFKEVGKELLSNFIADNGFQYVDTKRQHGQMEEFLLKQPLFFSKNGIFETDITT